MHISRPIVQKWNRQLQVWYIPGAKDCTYWRAQPGFWNAPAFVKF
jgi:hypothetical protein